MSEDRHDEKPTAARDIGVQSLKEIDWKILLKQIRKGTCVPFIGPNVCKSVYPSKTQIAQRWAEEEEYPLDDRSDLARVAQFLAVQNAPSYPVEKLTEEYEGIEAPNFADAGEPHRVLADLPLPLYITTNYDSFMSRALTQITIPRNPHREFCRWRQPPSPTSVAPTEYSPTPANPLVFHLFGYTEEANSLVLTEHDYLKFLVNVSKEAAMIPAHIRGAIAEGSLLFIGYHFNDWDFRVLIHTISNYLERSLGKAHISVVTPDTQQEAAIYLKLYFKNVELRIFWGTSQEFLAELRNRWKAFSNG
jgi:hypothetical protein